MAEEQLECIEYPRLLSVREIALIQEEFARHWQLVWRTNPNNPKMRSLHLIRKGFT